MNDGELILGVAGRSLSGWTATRVTRGCERMPNDFDITMTERFPGQVKGLVCKPGDPATVAIDSDLLITGYVDRVSPMLESGTHLVHVVGRSKSADLVDCSAEWPGGQITGSSALAIAQKLAQPYGINVSAKVDAGAPIPQFNLTIGETAYAIIERVCRYRGLLIYDLPDGNVTLAQVGSEAMGSGVVEGKNLIRAEPIFSMDERFSVYEAFLQSMDTLQDLGDGGNLLATVEDAGVTRHRLKTIIAEAGGGGQDVAKQRINWESARRGGRAYRLIVTVDSWRDAQGKPWTPNATIPVDIPSCHLPDGVDWVIGDVSLFRDAARGTVADMIIMPSAAFLPEPVLIQPFPADVPAASP